MKKAFSFSMAIALVAALTTTGYGSSCGSAHSETKSAKAKYSSDATGAHESRMDIVETAVAAGNFSMLVTALKAAGLVEALEGDGPFTVFAPSDEAFASLPEGTIENLLADKEKLASVLTYHVVSGTVKASEVVKLDKAQTLNGQSVMVKVNDDAVMIDDAKVIKTDIMASNGIIHVIDAVMLPPMED